MTRPIIYLSSPHTHPDQRVVDTRFEQARSATIAMMERGLVVYSPIVYTHPLWRASQASSIAESSGTLALRNWKHSDWLAFDMLMMERCDMCHVLMLEGWEKSKGIEIETNYFITANKPVIYLTLEEALYGN